MEEEKFRKDCVYIYIIGSYLTYKSSREQWKLLEQVR